MGMCRFDDENDDGYEQFIGVLRKFLAEIKSEHWGAMKRSFKDNATRKAG